MATTYLSRTNSSSGTSDKIFTYSFWIKRAKVDAEHCIAGAGTSQREFIRFETTGELTYRRTSGSAFQFTTARKFRDVGAWYNIVFNIDSRLASGGDRVKLYVNGVSETAVSVATDMGQNYTPKIGAAELQTIGKDSEQANPYFDGCMSHVHFIDGIRYDASYFGETDATTGEWKAKTSPSVTYGTNGFFILKDGNGITDQSSNSNDFTLSGGTLTDLKDNPDNVFCTMNALSKSLTNVVLSKCNTVVRNDSSANGNVLGTIALGNGKYYWENYKHGGGGPGLGLTLASVDGSNHSAIHGSRVNYYSDGYIYQNGFGLSDINTGVSYGDTDIIGVSVDTENGTIKFYKNGALVANSTQTNSVFTYSQNELIPFWFVINGGEWRTNLGNGYFGTTAVSSAGTNASGNGIFEYNVPSGFTALSTKGLNL